MKLKLLFSLSALLLSITAIAQQADAVKKNEFEAGLQVAQSQFDNWDGGGENTFSGRASLRYRHLYTKSKLTLDFTAATSYGMNIIEGDAFKNEDQFSFNFLSSWAIPKSNWAYAATANLRSQYSNGYASRTDNTLLSTFFAPAYLDLQIGFSYQKPGSPFSLVISPAAGSLTIVGNEDLSLQGAYGVTPGEHFLAQFGASIDARFDKKFGNDMFHYRSRLYSFASYTATPAVQWDNTFNIYPTKFLSISLLAKVYYDQNANIEYPDKLQYNYGFTVGLSYLFNSK